MYTYRMIILTTAVRATEYSLVFDLTWDKGWQKLLLYPQHNPVHNILWCIFNWYSPKINTSQQWEWPEMRLLELRGWFLNILLQKHNSDKTHFTTSYSCISKSPLRCAPVSSSLWPPCHSAVKGECHSTESLTKWQPSQHSLACRAPCHSCKPERECKTVIRLVVAVYSLELL